jgi:hypothetical protein
VRAAPLPRGAIVVAQLDSGPCYCTLAEPWQEGGGWLWVRLPGGDVWQMLPGAVDAAPEALGGLGGEPLASSPRRRRAA